MLERDYSVKWAWPRNITALVSLTLGVIFMLLFALTNSIAPQAAVLPQILGGILLAAGVGGIFIHTVEGLLRGGRAVLLTGLGLLLFVGAIIGTAYVFNGGMDSAAMAVLLGLPIVLILFWRHRDGAQAESTADSHG